MDEKNLMSTFVDVAASHRQLPPLPCQGKTDLTANSKNMFGSCIDISHYQTILELMLELELLRLRQEDKLAFSMESCEIVICKNSIDFVRNLYW
ncbi:hypothetical protein Plhal304r1_c029g0095151 [Plasmopara halstedii]